MCVTVFGTCESVPVYNAKSFHYMHIAINIVAYTIAAYIANTAYIYSYN